MRVLLNGVGRIGKAILRIAQEDNSLNIVAINELNTKLENITYSINYDSTYGKLQDKFAVKNDHIKNSHFNIKILNEKSLEDIDYDDLKIDIVIDASGAKVNTQILLLIMHKLFTQNLLIQFRQFIPQGNFLDYPMEDSFIQTKS